MTKKAFKYDMQRGLGSCVVALKNMQDAEKEKFFPLVLWGCSRDMAYDAQCEGCRSVYLYELITEFPDRTPFVDVIEKRLFQCIHSTGWEFFQDCELLSYFVSDGDRRSWKILTGCYDTLFQILLKKRKRTKNGLLPERDNFEALCMSMVTLCFDDHRKRIKLYQMCVKNIGFLAEQNTLYDVTDFEWFQAEAETSLGKKAVHKLLHREDADEYTKTYARMMEECRNMREAEWEKHRKTEPQTADELYMRLKNGEKAGKEWPLRVTRMWMRQDKEQEVLRLALYYKEESGPDIRYNLLRMLANEVCAEMLDLSHLIADSKSDHARLSERAFHALGYRKDAKVRAYALELLQNGTHISEAVSMLAKNYEIKDKEILVNVVKQIPITYEDGEWHGTFHDIMDLFYMPGKGKPKELLTYMYQNTLCSFCREYIVKEMGRRRMLTQELLEEMQYDSNEEIRKYAHQKLSHIQTKERFLSKQRASS